MQKKKTKTKREKRKNDKNASYEKAPGNEIFEKEENFDVQRCQSSYWSENKRHDSIHSIAFNRF